MNGPNEEWLQPQLSVPIKDGPDEEKDEEEKEKKNTNSQLIVATRRDDEKCHTVSFKNGMDVLAASSILPPKSTMSSLTTTRTGIIQTTATIRTPTATQEENEDTTAIATVHPQAAPSSSSLHAPTCVNNSGTWTFNVCSDLLSLKDTDDNMDDDDKTTTRTTTRTIKTTKTGPLVPETTTSTTPNEDDNVKNKDAPKQQPQPFFWFPCNPHQWSHQKRQFILFTRILLKYLYSRDRPRYHYVQQMLATLWQQHQQEQRQEPEQQHFGVLRCRSRQEQQARAPQRYDYSSSTSTSSNRKHEQDEQDALIRMFLQMHNRLQEVVTLEQWNIGRHYLEQRMIHRRRLLLLLRRQEQQIQQQRQRLIQAQRDLWQHLRRQELYRHERVERRRQEQQQEVVPQPEQEREQQLEHEQAEQHGRIP